MSSNRKFYLFILLIICFNMGFLFPKTYSLFQLSKEVEGSIVVPENNYCINNGFNKLSDCILVMENYATAVDSAKSYISSKKVASYGKIAPTITYKEITSSVSNTDKGVISTSNHFTLGASYKFDSSTGMFTLLNYTNNDLSNSYLDYYTCGSTSGTWNSCSVMYQIKAYKRTEDGVYRVTEAVKHSYNAVDALDSEIGLYATVDDLGTSYYYRGNVKNNYVSFAGYIWRIIRVNGNGTVRMIYSGTSTTATGSATQIGTSAYNSKNWDPTYVGYKYSENFAVDTTNTSTANFSNFNENASYYFGSSYEPVVVTGTDGKSVTKFKLTGNTTSGTFKSVHNPVNTAYPYTCFSTSLTGTCNYIVKIHKYVNNYTANVSFISYSSKDYNSTLGNDTDSTIKSKIDTWYKNNILNKYDNYLSDEVFCNDRSLVSGSGYKLAPTTTYGAYKRLYTNKTPSLQCSQDVDKFTVSTTKGNGALTYPIGLITADEVSLAGGVFYNVNTQYYLYTGSTYWTFSPSIFSSSRAFARAWYVPSAGYLVITWVSNTNGVRPVVNLRADVLISGGDGSAINPYVVKLDS